MTDDEVETKFRQVVEKMQALGLDRLSEDDLGTIDEHFARARAARKAAERPYAVPGLDVPWFAPEPHRPVKVWEPFEGIYAAISPNPIQPAFNGYVRLPEGHPWRERERLDDDQGPEVHGGITFGPHVTGWIGFDTGHAWDAWRPEEVVQVEVPREILQRWRDIAAYSADLEWYRLGRDDWIKHWTLNDLINEVNLLAQQVHDAM